MLTKLIFVIWCVELLVKDPVNNIAGLYKFFHILMLLNTLYEKTLLAVNTVY